MLYDRKDMAGGWESAKTKLERKTEDKIQRKIQNHGQKTIWSNNKANQKKTGIQENQNHKQVKTREAIWK